MTPTQQKAKAKAKELIGLFHDDFSTSIIENEMAIKCCDEVIDALNSIKGMGKIHTVKMWILVKENIENEK